MQQNDDQRIERRLDTIIGLLQNMLALELSRSGVNKEEIGKRLCVAKATVVEMLKDVKKGE